MTDPRDVLIAIQSQLARLEERIAHVDAELGKLRAWRHDLADKFSALAHVAGQLVHVGHDIRAVIARLAAVERRLAELDAARAERERLGVWARWMIPSGWIAAALAAVTAWWQKNVH